MLKVIQLKILKEYFMKKIINGIVVVEGKSDVAFLSTFIDAEFVTTNGSEISQDTINYLKEASKSKKIYVLTDPDSPGKRIRDVLDENINNLNHCFISKENSIKHGKVGVAESNKEEVIKALEHGITTTKIDNPSITNYEIYNLGLIGTDDSFNKRKMICDKLHIGFCNGKTFLKRLNYMNVTAEDIKNIYEK